MTSSPVEAADLLDLKLLPAWVKEPVEAKRYADVEGEHGLERPARHHRGAPTHRETPVDRKRASNGQLRKQASTRQGVAGLSRIGIRHGAEARKIARGQRSILL